MPVEEFKGLAAFQHELHGIVRPLQLEVLIKIGCPVGQDHRLLREIFQVLVRRLVPVMDACVWTSMGDETAGPAGARRVH